MKKLVQVQEIEGEGLVGLLGQNVMLFCLNYIYAGELIGVNTHDVILKNGKIVYETGPFDSEEFKDAQLVANELYIRTQAIESYSVTKKS